jgi:formylglycine-generating enzyme required for sulfatase activity
MAWSPERLGRMPWLCRSLVLVAALVGTSPLRGAGPAGDGISGEPLAAPSRGAAAGARRGGIPTGFVLIPGGSFRMGSPEDEPQGRAYERPRHEVILTRPILMSATEVTESQWASLMGSSPGYYAGCHD